MSDYISAVSARGESNEAVSESDCLIVEPHIELICIDSSSDSESSYNCSYTARSMTDDERSTIGRDGNFSDSAARDESNEAVSESDCLIVEPHIELISIDSSSDSESSYNCSYTARSMTDDERSTIGRDGNFSDSAARDESNEAVSESDYIIDDMTAAPSMPDSSVDGNSSNNPNMASVVFEPIQGSDLGLSAPRGSSDTFQVFVTFIGEPQNRVPILVDPQKTLMGVYLKCANHFKCSNFLLYCTGRRLSHTDTPEVIKENDILVLFPKEE